MRAFASLFALVLAGVALASPVPPPPPQPARKALSLTRRHPVAAPQTCKPFDVERGALVLAMAAPVVLSPAVLALFALNDH
jgi:hypothetical protein